jgi:GT2 family glycosyltransferase
LERIRRIRDRALRNTLLRHGYLILHRVAEVLREEGPKEALLKAGHKISLALRGRSFLVQPRERASGDLTSQYQLWLKRHSPGARDLRAMKAAIETFAEKPVISVLSVVVGNEKEALQKLIDTMRAQIYPHWELCLVTVSSIDTGTRRLLGDLMVTESRVRISASDGTGPALGTALKLVTGDFVGFLDEHDELAPEALFEVVKRLNEDPGLDLVYSDEDAVTPEGSRVSPFFKPDWNPDLLLSTNYVARFGILRRRLVEESGGFRSGLEGGHEYDLVLRATEHTGRIAHIPKILYHRRQGIPSPSILPADLAVIEAERHAIEDALRRRGLHGQVELSRSGYSSIRCYSVRYRVRGTPLVSIIIPTRDKWHLLEQCIRTIQEKTTYQQYEIIIMDNESTEPETRSYLDSIAGKCRVFSYGGGFNFAKINNFGATHAHGEYLLFLNNDVEVIRPDWLTAMLEHAQRTEVGAVGAKLLYPDGRIQHAGVVVGIRGGTGHAFRLWPGDEVGDSRLPHIIRNCSAVTAACMMVPRRVFDEVGGFDERFRVAFSDVDLCLRIRERGYLIVYTPFALLYHYEGASRGRAYPSKDDRLFRAVWTDLIGRGDPYYNPNLTDTRDDWSLRL